MSSKRRIAASQRNGARSRGPKTPAGKSRSSSNAISHGLLAKRVVLETESEPCFLENLKECFQKFAPRDGVEESIIDEIAAAHWRFHRALAIEKHLFDLALDAHPEGDGASRLGQAWTDLATSPALLSLHRYQTMLHRTHQRALHNFFLLRDMEPNDAVLPNEPS